MYLLLNYCTCFGRPSRLSSGLHKTVVAASGTDHTLWEAIFHQIRTQSLFGGRDLPREYDLCQRLQQQFYVVLMMGLLPREYDLYRRLQQQFSVILMMGSLPREYDLYQRLQ